MQTVPMTPAELAEFAKSAGMLARFAKIAQMAEEADAKAEAERRAAGATVAERMADDMRHVAGATGSCTVEDLVLKGWTRPAIFAHREEANRIALGLAGDARMVADADA